MLISYFRRGRYFYAEEQPAAQTTVQPAFQTRVDTTGSAQKQLLLDYEEDRICVVRHVYRNGSIGGRMLWPRAEPEYSDDCA